MISRRRPEDLEYPFKETPSYPIYFTLFFFIPFNTRENFLFDNKKKKLLL